MYPRKLPRISVADLKTSYLARSARISEPSIDQDYGNGSSASTSKVTYEPHYRRRVSSSERGKNMLLKKLEIFPYVEQ